MTPDMLGRAKTHMYIRNVSAFVCVATICMYLVYVSKSPVSTSTDFQLPADPAPALDVLYNRSYYNSDVYSANVRSPAGWPKVPGEHFDIMNMKPLEFQPTFKNPCWYCNNSSDRSCHGQLQCLPYFYIIGVKKCGTSDLHMRVHAHPDTTTNGFKEAQWFANRRFGNTAMGGMLPAVRAALKNDDPRNIRYYIKMFHRAASYMADKFAKNASYVNTIIADSSPSNFHNHGKWEQLPGNIGLTEPQYTNFHYIKHLIPQVKIIVIFRDPTDRLYSDYQHTARVRGKVKLMSTNDFHEKAVESIQKYEKCFRDYSIRRCIYDYSFKLNSFDFHAGFYAFFMNDLLSVFSKDQVLPLLFSEYVTNMSTVLAKVFRFLGLRQLTEQEMKKALAKSPANTSKGRQRKMPPMLPKTRKLLDDFYKPYNEDMMRLMNDSKYLFKKSG